MARIVPFSSHYKVVDLFDLLSKIALWASAILSLIVLALDIFDEEQRYKLVSQNFNMGVTIGSLCVLVIDLLHNYLFHKAEFNRKRDFIDNSFNSKLNDRESEEYFTNDEKSPGVYKLGVNCFENSFHSKNTLKYMVRRALIVNGILFLLFLALMFFSEHRVLASLLQIALPISIVIQTIKLLILRAEVTEIYERFKVIMHPSTQHQDAVIIANVMQYEKALSWATISLSSKIFNKYNAELSIEWNMIKQRYTT